MSPGKNFKSGTNMARSISTLGDVTDSYDVILCDVWGVLHNGIDAFPLAGEALTAARQKGLTVVLITNSPRPAIGVIPQLRAIGVPDTAYDRIVTSGDVTRTPPARKRSSCSAPSATCRSSMVSTSRLCRRKMPTASSAPASSTMRPNSRKITVTC
jgi:hypothetical protein